ncbi:MAG: protein kinase [Phycisphaerae bacterium]|nr:protein kinase [Gemmatimonadaceae bacterium]
MTPAPSPLPAPSPERWRELAPLLDELLDVEPSAREELLERRHGRDEVLRAELRTLLSDCEEGDNLLRVPAMEAFGRMLLTDQAIAPPSVLDNRYRLIREIGRGGMATVYLADDPKHSRRVAVKILHADVARVIGRERFAHEIEIVANLAHPHILPLHDSGVVPHDAEARHCQLYYVAPFVAGESLRECLKRETRLPAEQTAQIGREIAMALGYAHRRNVVHLDIKPENILLQDGHAVVADFGIARAISGATAAARGRSPHPSDVVPGTDAHIARSPLPGTPSYMSPEQMEGREDIDGRSDVYSLGCVLHEMLYGSRPGTSGDAYSQSPTAAAVALHAGEQVEAHVELARIIAQAMLPRREQRFADADSMAQALGRVRTRGGRRRPGVVRAGAIMLAGLMLAFALSGRYRGVPLDENLVAVAPFDVTTPVPVVWREGMVDLMSRTLDGAGPLRSVSASRVIHAWRGRADIASARALARVTGAGMVLFGGLLAAGDSLRINAVLLDARTGRKIAEFEQREVGGRMDRLSDSLTVAVLREIGRIRRIDVARATSSPTNSLASLKLYLQGEQFYRSARWDSAQTYFEDALAIDTAFALAYHRLAAVRNWRSGQDFPDTTTITLMRMPSRYAQGLGPRERLLSRIDSLAAEAHAAWNRVEISKGLRKEAGIVHALYATIDSALLRYPDDAEFSFLKADTRARYDRDIVFDELDDRKLLALFDRAIALDPSFAPAYLVPTSLAAFLDGADSARRYIRSYRTLNPTGTDSRRMQLVDNLLMMADSRAPNVSAVAESLSLDEFCHAATLMQHIPDSSDVVLHLARALMRQSAQRPPRAGPNCAFTQLVEGLQFRGHLREARKLASLQTHYLDLSVGLGMVALRVLPPDSVRSDIRFLRAMAPSRRLPKLLAWLAAEGDTSDIERYVDALRKNMRAGVDQSTLAMLRSESVVAGAYRSLAKRDTAAAVRLYLASQDTLQDCWGEHRAAFVPLLLASGHWREAETRLERRWPGTSACSNGLDDVMWTLARARVFERAGRSDEAMQNYAFVVAAWKNADWELRPVVHEAEQSLIRLRRAPPKSELNDEPILQ